MEVGAGATIQHGGATGAGFFGGVEVPVLSMAKAALDAVAGTQILPSYRSRSTVTLGGGLRYLLDAGPKLKVYGEGLLGIMHQGRQKNDPDPKTRTDFGFMFGGGVKIPAGKKLSIVAGADFGLLKESTHTSKGLWLSFGVMLPVGGH